MYAPNDLLSVEYYYVIGFLVGYLQSFLNHA